MNHFIDFEVIEGVVIPQIPGEVSREKIKERDLGTGGVRETWRVNCAETVDARKLVSAEVFNGSDGWARYEGEGLNPPKGTWGRICDVVFYGQHHPMVIPAGCWLELHWEGRLVLRGEKPYLPAYKDDWEPINVPMKWP
ncbi:MAG: hypothetical protein WC906_00820 [Parcubacteria group bacterium]|jgi:hypothetical protein